MDRSNRRSATRRGANTTGSITSLICPGTPQKYSDVNWMLSHDGGGLTAFADLVQMVTTPPHEGGFVFGVTWPSAPAVGCKELR
jgi:hypothetical protein